MGKEKLLISSFLSLIYDVFIRLSSLTLSRMTNFRLFQAERVCRRRFQIWWKWQELLQIGWKHCEKNRNCWLRVFSIFFHSVFKRLILQTSKNQGLFGKGLTHSHTMTPFDAPGKQAFRKHCGEKREIARNEQFLLFPQCFLPVWITFFHFCQIQNCSLQTLSVWRSLKFVVG